MKKYLMTLIVLVGFVVSINAACWSSTFRRNWNDDGNNYVEIKNVCRDTYTFVIKYYERESKKWQEQEIELYGGQGSAFNIGTATDYTIREK
jgi:hypothetical protein